MAITLLALCLACLSLASALEGLRQRQTEDVFSQSDPELGKRLYDFGLGKRAYRYVNEFKRLPMYDFGLGKRSKMYSFGLGKRADDNFEDESYDSYLDDGETVPETEMYDDDSMQAADKRQQKMYSFGLGKRPLYEFGLGKRARQYSFGLGKRERLYSFGLGKRAKQMYAFGLGKRIGEDSNLGKREVNSNELADVAVEEGVDDTNGTMQMDSHEQMGHGSMYHMQAKRSPGMYSVGVGKLDETGEPNFTRQDRKPSSYSFGLGKRRQMYAFGLGKRTLPA